MEPLTPGIVVSGLVGEAHVFDGASWTRVLPSGERGPSSAREARWVLGLDPAARTLSPSEDPVEALRQAEREDTALTLAIGCLDADLRPELRVRLSRRVERELADLLIGELLRDRFLGRRAPGTADFDGAIRAAREARAAQLLGLWTAAVAAQPALAALVDTVDEAVAGRGVADRLAVREELLHGAVLRVLATALGRNEGGRAVLELSRRLPKRTPVLQTWVKLAAKRVGARREDAGARLEQMRQEDLEAHASMPAQGEGGPPLLRGEVEEGRARALALLAGGQFDEARVAVEDLVTAQVAGAQHEFAAKTLCSMAAAAKGAPSLAEAWLERALIVSPHDPVPAVQLLSLLRERSRGAEAARRAAEMFRGRSLHAQSLCAWAEALRAGGEYDAAEERFREAQAMSPGHVVGWTGFAELMRARGRFDDAEHAYRRAQAVAPRDEVPWTGFAELMRQRGRLDEAERAYRTAQALAPQNEVAWTGFAELLRTRGLLDAAADAYRHAQTLAPHSDVVWSGFANLMRARGDFDAAERAYQHAQRLAPHAAIPWTGLAELLRTRGRFHEAERAFSRAQALAPHDAIVWTGYAGLLRASGRLQEAERAYRHAQGLAPHDSVVWCGFAELMRASARFDEAEGAYRRAHQVAPHDPIARAGFAELMKSRGLLDEAEQAYRAAQALAPHDAVTWTGFAGLMKARGRHDEAEQAYRHAQAIAPSDPAAWNGLAQLLRARGARDEARAAYEQALVHAPQDSYARLGLGLLLAAQGDRATAERLLHVGGRPASEGDWHLLRGQAVLALRVGDFAQARRLANGALGACPFVAMRPLFAAIVAVVAVRERNPREAVRILASPERDPLHESTRRVILLHAHGESDLARARREARDLPTAGRAEVIILRDTLIARYGLADRPADPRLEADVLAREEELLATG